MTRLIYDEVVVAKKIAVLHMPEDCGGLRSGSEIWIFNPGSPCQVVIPGVAC